MLKQHSLSPVSAEIELAIKQILRDDAVYTLTEMRSRHRENLVVPVTICFSESHTEDGFTRNISEAGVCIISANPMEENTLANLELYRLHGAKQSITSEIRWCRPFGKEYFMSGWKFMKINRNQSRGR